MAKNFRGYFFATHCSYCRQLIIQRTINLSAAKTSRNGVYSLLVTYTKQEMCTCDGRHDIQESRAVAREPRDAAAVVFGLMFADNIHYKFKSSQASKDRLQSSKRTGAKQNLTQNGHSKSCVLESVERR